MSSGTFAISAGRRVSAGGRALSKSSEPKFLEMEGTHYPSGSLVVIVKGIVSVPFF